MSYSRNQGPWDTSDIRIRSLNTPNLTSGGGSNIYAWGYNAYGQLATGDTINRSQPVQVSGSDWKYLAAGQPQYSMLASKSDDIWWGWGYNAYGQLGLNDTITRYRPTKSSLGSGWTKIWGQYYYYLGLKEDGSLWAWGYNGYASLGLNDATSRSSPIQIPGEWTDVGGCYLSTLAIRSDGTLWGWGYNPYGQLGLNDVVPRSSPIQMGTDDDWSKVHTSYHYNVYAQKENGALFGLGYNAHGELGQGNTIPRSSPVTVLGQSGTKFITSGTYYAPLAVHEDTALIVWGYNAYGGLGLNDVIPRSQPIQIGADYAFPISDRASYGLKTNGSLYAWGYQAYGEYGTLSLPYNQYRSSPILVSSGWRTPDDTKWDFHKNPPITGVNHGIVAITNPSTVS